MSAKTGSLNRPWIALEKPRPPAVEDSYAHWLKPPHELSDRCVYWLRQIERGWYPNKRWRAWGYDGSAQLYGVYIWEYLHVIWPALQDQQ